LALGILRCYFHVEPCISRARAAVVFVGKEADILVAEYVFEYLTRQCRLSLRSWQKVERVFGRRVTGNKNANFITGFFYGISAQLDEQREALFVEDSQFAIVLSDQQKAREEALDEMMGKTESVPELKHGRNRGALMSGYQSGWDTQLNPAIRSGEGRLALK
jgi:hypothetical protein